MRYVLAGLAVALSFATAPLAQEKPGVWVTYYIKADTNQVKGLMQVAEKDGKALVPANYSLKRVAKFIARDCASGKIGAIEMGKQKTKRKWTFVRQEFTTTCTGGPHPRIGATAGSVQIQIKRQPDGRDLAEYFFGRNGTMVTETKYR